jgi:type IV pilus assembly protein PilX
VADTRAQGGFALLTSILLLMIITILALGMFRGFATQEHISGNLREKERAFHSAVSVQQFAEYWLLNSGITSGASQTCASGSVAVTNTSTTPTICNVALTPTAVLAPPYGIGLTYLPSGMTLSSTSVQNNGGGVGGANATYAQTPGFYIYDAGPSADGQGEAYQIDAYSFGATLNTVAVVESVYELEPGMINRGGL